ncbi:MAG: DNA alkylation repair protein [Saprospiraceae bacterium]
MPDLVKQIVSLFEQNANAENAAAMAAYMKNNFPFWGIKTDLRRSLVAPYVPLFKAMKPDEQQRIITEFWKKPQRECHQAALDLSSKIVKKTDLSWLPFWEDKLMRNAWWDSVDYIAPSLIGPLLIDKPALQEKYAWQWMETGYLWKQRSALIFQIKYRTKTNAQLLFDLILSCASSKEFFLRKGSGWALREYGKYAPLEVSQFVNEHKDVLSGLTVREAVRNL